MGSEMCIRDSSITVKTIINGCHKNHLIFSDDLMLDHGKFALFTLHTHRHTHLRLLYNKDITHLEGVVAHLTSFLPA